MTQWTAVCQAFLSFTISQGLLKLMPSSHLILCCSLFMGHLGSPKSAFKKNVFHLMFLQAMKIYIYSNLWILIRSSLSLLIFIRFFCLIINIDSFHFILTILRLNKDCIKIQFCLDYINNVYTHSKNKALLPKVLKIAYAVHWWNKHLSNDMKYFYHFKRLSHGLSQIFSHAPLQSGNDLISTL